MIKIMTAITLAIHPIVFIIIFIIVVINYYLYLSFY